MLFILVNEVAIEKKENLKIMKKKWPGIEPRAELPVEYGNCYASVALRRSCVQLNENYTLKIPTVDDGVS